MDYDALGVALIGRCADLLPQWFPDGRFRGSEFKVGNLAGAPGDSLSVNSVTGVWRDFAGDAGGSDLISLYAAIHHLKQGEAAEELQERFFGTNGGASPEPRSKAVCVVNRACRPGAHIDSFNPVHPTWGPPDALYPYRDLDGEILFYIARYEPEGERKQICPWTWDGERWQMRAWPSPRPLYGLEVLREQPQAKVLIVEGEKCVAAARTRFDPRAHVAMCWPGGTAGVMHTDWQPLIGRQVTIWPDADEPGWEAAAKIARLLEELNLTVGIIDVKGQPSGWDIADLIDSGASTIDVATYARSHRLTLEDFMLSRGEPDRGEDAPIEPPADHSIEDLGNPPVRGESKYVKQNIWNSYNLEPGPGGIPWANLDNATAIVSQHPDTRDSLWFDEFHQRVMWHAREFDVQKDASDLNLVIQRTVHIPKMSTSTVAEAVVSHSGKNKRHPVREWLLSLPEAGEPQLLEQWLPRGMGTDDDTYNQTVSKNFLIGMVARAMQPGCQLDTMIVLEGAQGTGKTSTLRVLGGDWYTSNNASMAEKDFLQGLQGYWVIEVEEMHGIQSASLEKTKAILSRTKDEFRWSHGRQVKSYLRQCVFAGSTNSDSWNTDDTGARRFLPVECGKINLAWTRKNREALMYQALQRYQAGETWWEVPKETQARVTEMQELRRVEDPWEVIIARNLVGRQSADLEDAWVALDIAPEKRLKRDQLRIAAIYRLLGWKPRVTWKGGRSVKVYFPPGAPEPL